MASNIEIQEELNKLLQNATDMLAQQNKLLKTQFDLIADILEKAQKLSFKDITSETQQLNDALKETEKNSGSTANSQQALYEEVRKAVGGSKDEVDKLLASLEPLEKATKKVALAMSFWQGLKQGISGVFAITRSFGNIIGGMARTIGHVALSILSFPFSLLSRFIHDADAGGGSNELQQALEDIRKEFGYLDRTAGGAIVNLARSMKGELANTGLSVYRVFGNLAQRLQYFLEYAKNLGETIDAAMRNIDIRRDAEALGAFNKGLGTTAEGQKAIAQRSIATGTAIVEVNREIANYAIQLSQAFGVTQKSVSRDMANMMVDVRHFGHLSVQQLGQAAVFTRRLGIETKQLGNIMDRFANFEDAATSAAHLSQSFGLNLDAFQLMREQDPARQLDMLRKSFFAAGRSVESMSYQERRLLAQQTGLDDASVQLAFSLKSQSLSYDQITKKGDMAKKKQLSQAEALERLAGAIDRMVQSGGGGHGGGFLERFLQGFETGIKRSREYQEVMRNLRQDLLATFQAGIRVGRAFVESFPGIRDWFRGIAAIFEPRRFRQMLSNVTDAFRTFFQEIQTDPRAGFRHFMENMKRGFTSWFDQNSTGGRQILRGFTTFFRAMSGVFAEGLKQAILGVASAMRYITDIILHPERLGQTGTRAAGAAGFIASLFDPIIASIVEAAPVLWRAFTGLWDAVKPHLLKGLRSLFSAIWPELLGVVFGPAVVRTIISAFSSTLVSGVTGGAMAALPGILGAFRGLTGRVTESIPRGATGAVQSAGEAAGAANTAASAVQGSSRINWGSVITSLGMIALFIGGLYLLMPRFAEFANALKGLSTAQVLTAAAAMVALAGSLALIAVAANLTLKAANTIDGTAIARAALGLVVIGGFAVALVFGGRAIINAFKGFRIEDIGKAVLMMAAMSTFMLAVSAITVVAAGLGTALALTGPAGAAVLIGGLAAMALVTEAIKLEAINIMRSINQLNVGPNFTEKAKAFGVIMTAIGSFAGSFAQIAAATRPGIFDFLSGSDEQRRTLDSINNIINSMSSGLIRIVNTIVQAVSQLSGTERQVKSAEMIGNLLTGVGNLAKALQPPTEALPEPGVLARLFGASGPERTVSLVTDFVNTMSNQLRLFVAQLANTLTNLPNGGLSEGQVRGAQAIGAILGSVGELAKNLRASAALVQNEGARGNLGAAVTAIGNLVRDTLNAITNSDLFRKVGELLTTFVNSMAGLNNRQIESVKALAPVLGPVFQTIAQISTIISGIIFPPPGNNSQNIANGTTLLNTFFERIQTSLPTLVTGMRNAFQGLDVASATALAKGTEALKAIFEVVTSVPTMLRSFTGIADARHATTTLSDIEGGLIGVNAIFSGSGGRTGITELLRNLITTLNTAVSVITNPAEFTQKINAIKTVFDVIGGIPAMLEGLRRLSGVRGGGIATNIMEAPLQDLNRIIESLTSRTIEGTTPNPLLNNGIMRKLQDSHFDGIPDQVRTRITGTVDAIKTINNSFGDLTGLQNNSANLSAASANMVANVTAFASLLTNTGTPINALMTNVLPSFMNNVRTVEFASISRNLRNMVQQINNISNELNNIRIPDINTTMRNVANVLGVRSEELTITHGNFTVHINLNVQMDAAQIESAVVNRPSSRIEVRPATGLHSQVYGNRGG